MKVCRMFVIQRRDAATLIPIIRKNAKMGSDIHSDEWLKNYSKLKNYGNKHFTVNFKENFVNPKTGKHTQLVECLWGVNKKQIPNRIRGKSCGIFNHYYLIHHYYVYLSFTLNTFTLQKAKAPFIYPYLIHPYYVHPLFIHL